MVNNRVRKYSGAEVRVGKYVRSLNRQSHSRKFHRQWRNPHDRLTRILNSPTTRLLSLDVSSR